MPFKLSITWMVHFVGLYLPKPSVYRVSSPHVCPLAVHPARAAGAALYELVSFLNAILTGLALIDGLALTLQNDISHTHTHTHTHTRAHTHTLHAHTPFSSQAPISRQQL
jgi:hypothetical protein